MIIAQLSDTHLTSQEAEGSTAKARAENLSATVTRINAIEGVDAVIHTGDMVHNRMPGEYALAHEILSMLSAPLYVVPGNRDCRESLRRTFGSDGYMTDVGDAPILYSVNKHSVRLIGFDTQAGHYGETSPQRKGDLDAARLDWLDTTLTQAPNERTMVFMHHPPIPIETSQHPWQWLRQEVGNELGRIIGRHPQVIRIFCGHSHRDYMGQIAGTCVSTQPSIAVDLRLGEFSPELEERPVFQVHSFENEQVTSETLIAG